MMLGLYLHVPFCQAICTYCNFNRGLLDPDLKTRYVNALVTEIVQAGDGGNVDTIFFGGGTPSVLTASEVARLLTACREAFTVTADVEVTLESNPETVTAAYLADLRRAGVNRLSFGVQSFDDEQLARLGRIHTAARAVEAVGLARAVGFENVSCDLMFWLPGQSRASWRASLEAAIALQTEHVSLYLLELYPNAPLRDALARAAGSTDQRTAVAWAQASDDEAADMYLEGLAQLDQAGLEQYEISNVSRPGRESRHNLKYWTGGRWRGFGCGAHSTMDAMRWKNVASTTEYVARMAAGESVAADRMTLSAADRQSEALFTGLRLTRGIDRVCFERDHGIDPLVEYGRDLASFVDAGQIWIRGNHFGLTRDGMLVSNEILAVFV